MIKKLLVTLLLFLTAALYALPARAAEEKKNEWGLAYMAIAGHYFGQGQKTKLMPNRVDDSGYLVRLPRYFALSRAWENGGEEHFAQISYFENSYSDPSGALTYAKRLEDYSWDWVHTRVGGVLYIRKLPRDLYGQVVNDFAGEVRVGEVGAWFMPAVMFSVNWHPNWRFDLGVSGVVLGQLTFIF